MKKSFASIALVVIASLAGCVADEPVTDDAADAGALGKLVGSADRGRQRRTMADMRNIGIANGTMRVDTGKYAASLKELGDKGYMTVVPTIDAWGNAYAYKTSGDSYTVTSLGSDGEPGPAPPVPWAEGPYDPDLTMSEGQFTQMPTGR